VIRSFRAATAAVVACLALPTTLPTTLPAAPSAHAEGEPLPVPPPYIDHVEWAKWGDLSSLRVYPTPNGRQASGRIGLVGLDEAWAEVVALDPQADRPGMFEQFRCHWQFAELAEPGKTSWNLEPWRPVVDYPSVVVAGCNPGGSEEPF